MFVRFVIGRLDPDSGRRQGLFQAVGELVDARALSLPEHHAIVELQSWFGKNLQIPRRFSVSARPRRKAQAIGWFRDTATEHVARMRAYQRLLEAHGQAVEVLCTHRPGYVVYEDDFQIAAYPFADTPC